MGINAYKRPEIFKYLLKPVDFFCCYFFRDPASANENANDAIVSDRIEMKIGYFQDIQRDGSVACIPIGRN